MLGASFFQEMNGGKRASKLKTYHQSTLVNEDIDDTENDQYTMAAESLEDDDQAVEVLAQEGDDDAALVMDFESAELLQNDEELASAFTAYTDARRRLNEKVRSRGFWPISQKGKSKGSWKGPKGNFPRVMHPPAENPGVSMQTLQSSWTLESRMPKSPWYLRCCCPTYSGANDHSSGSSSKGWVWRCSPHGVPEPSNAPRVHFGCHSAWW